MKKVRALIGRILLYRRARRRFRALCRDGQAPTIEYSIHIHPESMWRAGHGEVRGTLVWGCRGVTSLDRFGRRHLAGWLDDLEDTCVRIVIADMQREDAERKASPGR